MHIDLFEEGMEVGLEKTLYSKDIEKIIRDNGKLPYYVKVIYPGSNLMDVETSKGEIKTFDAFMLIPWRK